MLGSRTRLFLLTSFFTFAFALLLLALVQNYTHAGSTSLALPRSVVISDTSGLDSPLDSEIVPTFGVDTSESVFDFASDDSFQKYLHTDHPFSDMSYVPTDLVAIDSNFTANNSRAFTLRQEAAIQFADMAWHFRHAFSGDRLYIASAYRSRGLQDYLIRQGCALIKCAPSGTSEHQAGLAVDIKVIGKGGKGYSLDLAYPNKYYTWLKANAARFGFHNTYQKGVAVDGKIVEGRHRRYLGAELATILSENNQTLAEYYNGVEGGELRVEAGALVLQN